MCAEAERYVGVEGGGMDQAIEVLANKGSAMLINFNPLRFSPVSLPKNAFFAVIHSGKAINKAANSQYNERVVECRLAAQVYDMLIEFIFLINSEFVSSHRIQLLVYDFEFPNNYGCLKFAWNNMI